MYCSLLSLDRMGDDYVPWRKTQSQPWIIQALFANVWLGRVLSFANTWKGIKISAAVNASAENRAKLLFKAPFTR